MKNRLRKELEAMLELHTGDSFTADNVHTLVNGIFAADEGGGFEYVEYDDNAFPYPQTIGDTAPSITGLGPADESMIDTIFIMPNKETDPDATMMIVVDEKEPSTDPKTYQYVYVGNINDLPSDVLTEGSIVNDLSTGGTDKPLSAEQGRTLNSHVNYTTCGSGAGDQVKLISDDGFELSTHLRLLVRMTNTNTNSTPKFNINNTGIKDVWYNGSVASDTNTWSAGEVLDIYYNGTNYVATTYGGAQFSTGEKVGDVGIDNEPTAGSENLVKSEGIYTKNRQYDAKLYDITKEEIEPEKTIYNDSYISGDDGIIRTFTSKVVEIDVSGYTAVRFLGLVYPESNTTADVGYSFGYYKNNQFVPTIFERFKRDSLIEVPETREYLLQIPQGVSTFRITNAQQQQSAGFYCYIQKGNSVSEFLHEKENPKTILNVPITSSSFTDNMYVRGTDGALVNYTSDSIKTFITELNNCDIVNVLGVLTSNSSTSDVGYSFGHYKNGVWITDGSSLFERNKNTLQPQQYKNYELYRPAKATHFAITITAFTIDNFYCILEFKKYNGNLLGRNLKSSEIFTTKAINIDEDTNVYLQLEKNLNIDSICYENKTFRDVFLNGMFYWDIENDKAKKNGIDETLNITSNVSRVTNEKFIGNYSLKIQTSSSSSYVTTTTGYVIPKRNIYCAYKCYMPQYSQGTIRPIFGSTPINEASAAEQTNSFKTFSGIAEININGSDLFFGAWGSPNLICYIDNIVCVDMSIFDIAPSKEKMDELYELFLMILQDRSVVVSEELKIQDNLNSINNFGFSDKDCVDAFMQKMNDKAQSLGMLDSYFYNPYGGNKYGFNTTTSSDMLKMMVAACDYRELMLHASANCPQAIYRVYNSIQPSHAGDYYYPATAGNTKQAAFINAYRYLHNGDYPNYTLLTQKGAGWSNLPGSGSTTPDTKVRGFVGTALINEKEVVYAVFAKAYEGEGKIVDPTYGTLYIHQLGLVQLLDICEACINGDSIEGMSVTYCNCAVASVIPNAEYSSLKGIELTPIYALNSTTIHNPASATKVLAVMTALDIVNIEEFITVNEYDYNPSDSTLPTYGNPNDSGNITGEVGDKMNVDAALWYMLGSSNGVVSLALARYCGAQILYNKELVGII